MSATLVVKDLSGGHAHRTLFSKLSFTVAPGDVIGVVGANGAGKSTLLSLLAGAGTPQAGIVSTAPQDAFVGWLPQEHVRLEGETVAAYIGRRTGCTQATEAMETAADALGSGNPADADRYADALDHWMACGAADLDERIPATLAELGLAVGAEATMTGLSGGQVARVALAALLLSRFDIVLLDEPTNDLDLAGLARLEEFVTGLRGGVVLVSHDREFMARCITSVVELDLVQNKVAVYDGGYDSFLEERAIAKQAQKVRQMESRISRLEEVEEPRKEWALQFSIGAASRSSTVVSTLNAAVVQQGDFTLGPISVQVNAGERIGITGPNGAGKSTLLQLLLGQTPPDAGTASLGANVAIGEIDQSRSQFPDDDPLGAAFESLVPELNQAEIRTLLAKFGLKADQVTSAVGALSPGERTRASLALLQARGVNVLVLDEPTNHLDLIAIEQLEEALDSYTGTLLLVTHDRRLLENVHLDTRWSVGHGQLTEL